jgi:integrase
MSENRTTIVWVQHRGDRPYLTLDWHDPVTGQRKSKSSGTCNPVEAEKLRANLQYELNHGLFVEPSRVTWERFRELFETEYLPSGRPATQGNHRSTLNLFERLCHPKTLRSIDEAMIWQFYAALRKLPGVGRPEMLPSSIEVRLQFLRTALHWAQKRKLIPECPAFPSVKVPKKRPQLIPVESFERLVEKARDQHMRTFLLCGWLAGLRIGEALALEWDPSEQFPWIDFDRSRIVLPAEFTKGVEDQWVPLDPELREAFLTLPRTGKKVFRFVTARAHKPIGLCAVSHRIITLARRAGVKLTMKSLRKGFGCRYAGKVSAHVLQKLMRHSNIRTTLDYYVNIDTAVEEAVLGQSRSSSRSTTGVVCTDSAKESNVTLAEGEACH